MAALPSPYLAPARKSAILVISHYFSWNAAMARKRKGGNAGLGALLPIIVVFALLAQVPKQAWVVIGIVAALVIFVWLVQRTKAKALAAGVSSQNASSPLVTRSAPNQMAGNTARSVSAEFHRVQIGSGSDLTFSIPAPSENRSKARWLGLNEVVEVAGLRLPGGLLYFAQNAPMFGYEEPSLIDASQQVRKSAVDISVSHMSYWPRYNDISPEARRGYLQWQASGRSDPDADIGYVFLFFYGLERRALVDAREVAEARQEVPVIEQEVRRLLALYGQNHSFRGYASRFLEHLNIGEIAPRTYLQAPSTDYSGSYELPMPLRIALGQMAVDKSPLNSAWALAWALSDPNIGRRTPVTRCRDKFALLFKEEYSRRYPNGIVLTNNKTKLQIAYRPASSRLDVIPVKLGDLPDVSATSGTRNKLQTIVDDCSTILDPYSRYLGRNPEGADSLDGLVQLPTTLWPAASLTELELLKESVGVDTVCMSFCELSGRFKFAGVLSRDKLLALARALESLSIGFEPDVLSGARTPKADDTIALFAILSAEGTARADDAYNTAVVTLDLASAVAAADGDTSLEEIRLLLGHIDSWDHLSPAHRRRLSAHLAIQLKQPPTLASLKKKLEPLGLDAKRKLASFLAHLAQADGVVSPQEVKLLERVYKALSLDPQAVYSDLHSAAAGTVSTSPVTSAPAPGSIDSSNPPAASAPAFALDMNKIARLQRETAEVSALLAGVFVDETAVEAPAPQPQEVPEAQVETEDATLYGLDIDHSAFLRLLVSRKEWSRAELEDAAADLDLMLDGALENINDMAFERFDIPVSEGDDPIEINPEILDELAL